MFQREVHNLVDRVAKLTPCQGELDAPPLSGAAAAEAVVAEGEEDGVVAPVQSANRPRLESPEPVLISVGAVLAGARDDLEQGSRAVLQRSGIANAVEAVTGLGRRLTARRGHCRNLSGEQRFQLLLHASLYLRHYLHHESMVLLLHRK